MSIRLVAAVLDGFQCKTPSEKLLMVALADQIPDEGSWCWPGQERLATRCALSREWVGKTLKALKNEGLLEIERGKWKGRMTTYYRFTPKMLEMIGNNCPRELSSHGDVNSVHTKRKGNRKVPPFGGSATGNSTTSPHKAFIETWCQMYEQAFGDKYVFHGGRDGAAVKRLLETGMEPDKLVSLAVKAWGRASFNCKQSTSITGFASRINEIRHEFRMLSKGIDPEKSFAVQREETEAAIGNLKSRMRGKPRNEWPMEAVGELEQLNQRLQLLQQTPSGG